MKQLLPLDFYYKIPSSFEEEVEVIVMHQAMVFLRGYYY